MMVAKHVRNLEAYVPGEQPKSRGVLKLNTNENPYPPSPKCAEAIKKFDVNCLRRYCDPNCTELRKALAALNGTVPERIFVGNGSDEILAVAARTFVEDGEAIASLDPSYSLYRTLAAIRDVPWVGLVPRRDDDDIVSQVKVLPAKTSLFLFANPNAPTGDLRSIGEVTEFARRFRGVVIVDEAYADFAQHNCMALAAAEKNRNLIVMRTFSKSFSLAGLRVGYCVGPQPLIDAMYKVKDSYNVDAIAQCVALAAVKDVEWMRKNVRKVIGTRQRVTAELRNRGWKVISSEANFIFAKPSCVKASWLFEELRNQNVFVRYFKGPKTGGRLRITMGTDADMNKFLKAIDELDR